LIYARSRSLRLDRPAGIRENGKADFLQKIVLEETWAGKKYPEIAQNCNRGHDRIKKVARKLWQLISK